MHITCHKYDDKNMLLFTEFINHEDLMLNYLSVFSLDVETFAKTPFQVSTLKTMFEERVKIRYRKVASSSMPRLVARLG